MSPQEAATPVEALAAELGVLAAQHEQNAARSRRNSTVESFHRGVAAGLTNTTGRLRHNLAPAWDALAAERDKARQVIRDIANLMDSRQTTMIDAWDGIRLIVDEALKDDPE